MTATNAALPGPTEFSSQDAFFEHIEQGHTPAVLRNAALEWSAVVAAKRGDEALVDYLATRDTGHPVYGIVGQPDIRGRFGFNAATSDVNYAAREAPLTAILGHFAQAEAGHFSIAIQAAPARKVFRDWEQDNPGLWVRKDVEPTLWVSMASRVAPHSDIHDNVAVVAGGARRFTLFPPEQIENLYLGPLLSSPGSVPTSSVDIWAPDLDRHPRFEIAIQHALACTLEPGDAIFIPALWWHAVESLRRLNVLVNYWFGGTRDNDLSLQDALAHAIMAFARLPEPKRQRWAKYFEHLVFRSGPSPSEHLSADLDDLITDLSDAKRRELRTRIGRALAPDDTV